MGKKKKHGKGVKGTVPFSVNFDEVELAPEEDHFNLNLLVQVQGFGTDVHERKKAANIKRLLQTALHDEVQVTILQNVTLQGKTEVVTLDNRNALAGWDDPPRQ